MSIRPESVWSTELAPSYLSNLIYLYGQYQLILSRHEEHPAARRRLAVVRRRRPGLGLQLAGDKDDRSHHFTAVDRGIEEPDRNGRPVVPAVGAGKSDRPSPRRPARRFRHPPAAPAHLPAILRHLHPFRPPRPSHRPSPFAPPP